MSDEQNSRLVWIQTKTKTLLFKSFQFADHWLELPFTNKPNS